MRIWRCARQRIAHVVNVGVANNGGLEGVANPVRHNPTNAFLERLQDAPRQSWRGFATKPGNRNLITRLKQTAIMGNEYLITP